MNTTGKKRVPAENWILMGLLAADAAVSLYFMLRPPRNWLFETGRQEHERRISALEEHIKFLEDSVATIEHRLTNRLSHMVAREVHGDVEPLPDIDPMTQSLPLPGEIQA